MRPAESSLEAEANRCVACGLCLPYCPTYRKTESEADSPRGRVMLLRALFEGRLKAESELAGHLHRCLLCRACEAVCPAGVAVGALMDGGRAVLAGRGYRPRPMARGLAAVLTSPRLLGGVRRVRFRPGYPAPRHQGAVSLFLGCVGTLMDAVSVRAAIFVLNRLGYDVHIPPGQGCCGAMDQHGGNRERAEALARKNIAAFHAPPRPGCGRAGERGAAYPAWHRSPAPFPEGKGEVWPILFFASGCGASLVAYDRYGETGAQFAERAMDIVSFLAQAPGWDGLDIAPLAETVAVHEPCTARNVLRNAAASYRLLERIPAARLVPLPGNDQCCGSAGLYFLSQPQLAAALRLDKMAAVRSVAPRYVVSTNYGCARWLGKKWGEEGPLAEVLHPVTLLARQMGFTGRC